MDYKVQGDKLIITVDIGKKDQDKATPSKSGKSRIVAGTGGFAKVEKAPGGADISFALNVIIKD